MTWNFRRWRAWDRQQSAFWFGVWGWALLATDDTTSTVLLDDTTKLVDGTTVLVDGT